MPLPNLFDYLSRKPCNNISGWHKTLAKETLQNVISPVIAAAQMPSPCKPNIYSKYPIPL
jgi:hypothetical protein